jgi:hypothetical protein
MSKPLEQPELYNVYLLIKQSGASLSPVISATPSQLGVGFYWTREEAEQHRTMEILKLTATDASKFHIYELEVPNLAKK